MTPNCRHLALYLALALLLTSCATPVTRTELVPTEEKTFASTGKRIVVLPVTIRPRPKPGFTDPAVTSFPDADSYLYAVVNTLNQSGLFPEVKTEGTADYSLSTEVIAERILGSMNNVVLILVRYELVDNETGNTVWNENLLSHFELSAGDVFMGTERIAKALEGAVRANMDQLDDKLAHALAASST